MANGDVYRPYCHSIGGDKIVNGYNYVGGYTAESVTHGRCDSRPTLTFPTKDRALPLPLSRYSCPYIRLRVVAKVVCINRAGAISSKGRKLHSEVWEKPRKKLVLVYFGASEISNPQHTVIVLS